MHTDSQADDLNGCLQARAFTTGRDIFFGAGQYTPATREGRRLLAHELSHVVQQGQAGIARRRYDRAPHRAEADDGEQPSIERASAGAGRARVTLAVPLGRWVR